MSKAEEKLTIEQIIGGIMIQFAKEYHQHNGFYNNKFLLSTILKHKVENCKAMLDKTGYLPVEPVQLEVLGDEEIEEWLETSNIFEELVKRAIGDEIKEVLKQVSQATITHNEKKFGELYRRLE